MSNLIAKAAEATKTKAAADAAKAQAKNEEEARGEEAEAAKEAEARAKAEADLSAKMKAQPSDFVSEDEQVLEESDSLSLASGLSMTFSSDADEMMETPRDRNPKTKPTDQGDKKDSKKFRQAQRNVRQSTKTGVGKRAQTETYE